MKKRQRLTFILFVLACLSVSAGLALYALRGSVTYFKSPREALAMPPGRVFRLGGMVVKGSLEKRRDDLTVVFRVTDFKNEITVAYKGIVPDLFREGQGVVATGSVDADGLFTATELLAKHDEKYMPPEVEKIMKQ